MDLVENYLKTSLKYILKNKFYFLINFFGLTISFSASLFIANYVLHEYSYDDSYSNKNNIYRIVRLPSKNFTGSAKVSLILGPNISEKFPEAENYVRFVRKIGNVSNDEKNFYQDNIFFVDESIFEILSLDILQKHSDELLSSPNTLVISNTLAKIYFGDDNPIGKFLSIDSERFEITGVFADIPDNTHLKFDLLLSYNTLINQRQAFATSSKLNIIYTYIQLLPGTNRNYFESKLNDYIKSQYENYQENDFALQRLNDIYLQSDLPDEAGITGSISAVRILILLVVIILCLGWLNYVVLTTTSASERINEYYVRKVLGSSKWQLIKLKLLESFIISTCAFLVSTSLFFLGKNLYKILINRDLNFIPFERLEVLLVVLLIFTSGLLIISFYPALTLISFNIRDGLTRGSGVVSPKLNFRRYLMIFEITVTSVLLSGSILINKQINYMQKEDKNFNVDQFIIESPRNADLSFERRMKLFKETIRNNLTFVNGISYSSSVPGSSMVDKIGQVHLPSMDDKVNETVYFVEIDEDYIPNYDIPIVAGKNFTSDSKYYEEIIINMKTLAILGFSNPQEAIDQIISTEDESFRIIGVVEDFHIETLKNDFKPLFFIYDDAAFGFMAVNFKKNVDLNSSIEQIKQFWEDVFPENEFVYFNLSDYFDQQYYKYNEFGKIIIAFTIFSIIIACISLFGSTWHSINNKKKEIGIRKVFGSDKLNVAKLLLKDITFIHLIAFGISIPIAYIISAKWLESFAYHISLDIISLILVPCVIIFIISIATVIYQTIKVSFVSPITVLRDE